ncbi:uncharacterized protein LOC124178295 [Neodiprion fabricii]|uniref:uncharacterized protein LOC124178295 n=1 Tax=Neodiprion fabricii TaxID=2872261 RepID=UPI001ED8E7F0|nr:uncharacterized protein LOC124178295 [Neodiprion fabricii]
MQGYSRAQLIASKVFVEAPKTFYALMLRLSFAVVFSTSAIAGYLTTWLFFHNQSNTRSGPGTPTDVSTAIHYLVIAIDALIVPLLVTIWITRGRRRVHRVISTFATVDEKLSKFGQCPSRNSSTWKLIILICAPLVTAGVIIWIDVNYNEPQASKLSIFRSIFLHFHEFVRFYTLGFFASLVLLIGDRYKAVNSVLKTVLREHSYDLTNTRQIVSEWVTAVRELRALHRKLFFAAEDIQLAFNFQLLVLGIITLMSAIGELYKLYLANISLCGSPSLPAFAYLLLFSLQLGPAYFAAFSCSCTCDQAKRTAALIQEITVVDENLCLEIVETIATYLIILIQIGTVPQNCQNSHDSGLDNFVNSSINRGSNIS